MRLNSIVLVVLSAVPAARGIARATPRASVAKRRHHQQPRPSPSSALMRTTARGGGGGAVADARKKRTKTMMIAPKMIIELIGTAVLVFTIQVAVSSGSDLAPLAIGGVLVSLVFAGGPVSGGHYNPAVSLAVTLRGKMEFPDMISYIISQILGGVIGGFLGGVVGAFNVLSAGEDASTLQALLAEGIFAFVLCFVVLSVATNPKVDDNHYYGLAIGLVVVAGAVAAGPISGGAFNPAVALGLSISGGFSNLLYVLLVVGANLLGGAVAAGCFRVVVPAGEEVVPAGERASLYQSVN